MTSFKIGSRCVGAGAAPLIIAEMSGNHNQSLDVALQIVEAAARAGAHALKLQTYTADTITLDSDKEWFRVGGKDNPRDWQGQTLYQLYQKANTPWDWHPKLQKIAESLGLIFFSTPFDDTAVDFLEKLDVPVYKIASYEATDTPLLKKVATAGKPVILSVGFATIEEIKLAVKTLRENGCREIALLHCLTSYGKAPSADTAYLGNIQDLADRFGVVSGFSDNNAGIELPIAAVRAGAVIVEKHLTLSRAEGGPDAQFSLETSEFAEMTRQIRAVEKKARQREAGEIRYGPANEQEEYNKRFRRSIFVARNIAAGEKFTAENVRVVRPAFGLEPKYYEKVLGRVATSDITAGTPLKWDLIKDKE